MSRNRRNNKIPSMDFVVFLFLDTFLETGEIMTFVVFLFLDTIGPSLTKIFYF